MRLGISFAEKPSDWIGTLCLGCVLPCFLKQFVWPCVWPRLWPVVAHICFIHTHVQSPAHTSTHAQTCMHTLHMHIHTTCRRWLWLLVNRLLYLYLFSRREALNASIVPLKLVLLQRRKDFMFFSSSAVIFCLTVLFVIRFSVFQKTSHFARMFNLWRAIQRWSFCKTTSLWSKMISFKNLQILMTRWSYIFFSLWHHICKILPCSLTFFVNQILQNLHTNGI